MSPKRLIALFAVLLHLPACPEDAATGAETCVVEPVNAQQTVRLSVGTTLWLPKLSVQGDCAGLQWKLVEAPPTSANAVVAGDDGFHRFSVDAAGTYRFEAGTLRYDAEVVDGKAPFHNLNHYPSARSLIRVGADIWVADPLNHHVTQLSAADLSVKATIPTGSWPVALGATADGSTVVVAQRGTDTLGFIEVGSARLTDAVWVGDEPSNVVVSADGKTAYVALSTEAAVAVVDLEARQVTSRLEAVVDPRAMTLSEDGTTLFVASHRSGHPNRYPYEADPSDDERDIAIIDVATGTTSGFILDVGTTLNSLHAAGGKVWITRTRNDTEANLGDPEEPSFMHEVAALEPVAGVAQASTVIDITRAADSGGHAVSLHGLQACDGVLWVAAESSDAVVAIDVATGVETSRVVVDGRPRGLTCGDGAVWVHGHQALKVTRITAADASVSHEASTGEDPRPADMAAGQRYFTGAGRDFAQNWSCNSCHTDGLTDTIIWNAGPFSDRVVSRPFFWLEGTFPLGWAGYMSNVTNYAYTVNTNVGVRPNTAEATNLAAYLKSIMPPAAANGWTGRDGSLSAEALEGQRLFEGDAGCASCHGGPLTTNRALFQTGITEGASDVPSLVGIYRHNVWLKHGEARTLRQAVQAAADAFGATLDAAGVDAVTRYVQELTARDFFALTQLPAGEVAPGAPLTLVMSHPIFEGSDNLTGVTVTADEMPVDVDVEASGRYLTVTPTSTLPQGAQVVVTLADDFESYAGHALTGATTFTFQAAATPALSLEGDYVWTVDMPLPDFATGQFGDQTVATSVPFTVGTEPDAVFDYGEGLEFTSRMVVSGATVDSGPLPIPIGPSFSDSTGFQGTLVDEDGDGIADSASGTVTISGPGFLVDGVTWTLSRPVAAGDCDPGDSADTPPNVRTEGDDVIIDWGNSTDALGLFVVAPDAEIPLGPGAVKGTAYWVLSAAAFPVGFAGPVTYGIVPEGAVDATEDSDGPAGGAPLTSGTCYKFVVIGADFSINETIVVWP